VYAAGDVIGFPALASTSMEQARVAMCHAFELGYKTRVSPHLPYGLYTIPEVSMCGTTEEDAIAAGIDVTVGRARYGGCARGQIVGDLDGLLKLVFRTDDKRLIGVHVLGERATELVHIGEMVMLCGGTIDAFIDAVFNYPTLSELYKYAAYDGLGNLARRKTLAPSA
jgi:NAD(P) transhydrogenase